MADKKTCFVIMRFESPYEERCEQIYKPAIVEAGLEPRLARGPGVVKITDAIKEGINNSHLCLIDISEDNPNVWSELGIALSRHGRMAMVCDEEKRNMDALPTDIRDRQVIPYRGGIVDSYRHARVGFRLEITEDLRLKAGEIVAPVEGSTVAASSQNSAKSGDANIQLNADQVAVMKAMFESSHETSHFRLFESSGMSKMRTQLAVDALVRQAFIIEQTISDTWNNEYPGYQTLEAGKSWCEKNREDLLAAESTADNSKSTDNFSDMEDVPF